MMRKILFIIIFLLSNSFVFSNNSDSKDKFLLNGVWDFKYLSTQKNDKEDSLFYEKKFASVGWSKIVVPSCWETIGVIEPAYGGSVKTGIGLYRRSFILPKTWCRKNIFITFDGVGFGYRFWINGKYVDGYNSSFNQKTFDITSYLKVGETNLIAVEVSTKPRGWQFDTCDDWSFSGIFRDVYLTSVPQCYIKDVDLVTLVPEINKAKLKIKVDVNIPTTFQVEARLQELSGGTIEKVLLEPNYRGEYRGEINIYNPKLWTAETPHLYKVYVSLIGEKNNIIHQKEYRIGLREVSIEGSRLKLNGKVIKLKGINLHEESPINGRSITDKERIRDLELIKRANINFIRTSHYPPSQRLIELCDSMGFYVMEEVPYAGYGGGRELLKKNEYLDEILKRSHSTIMRDKNYTSVILWSLGNENPVTDNGLKSASLVKRIDPSSRPVCMPMMGSYFQTVKFNFPDSIDIYAPHYPSLFNLNEYETDIRFNRPFIITEYAHAYGLGFDKLESQWDFIYKSDRISGGAIWHFFDQGLLRKSIDNVDIDKFTLYAWKDKSTYFDTGEDRGVDGIVYADRTPQVDYWLTRKVYSPVVLYGDTIEVTEGNQNINLICENRYDFLNLSELEMQWELCVANKVLQSGTEYIECEPKNKVIKSVNVSVPSMKNSFSTLKVRFVNKSGYQIYEKNYVLKAPFIEEIRKEDFVNDNVFSVDFESDLSNLTVSYLDDVLIKGLGLRVGRKMALWNLYDKDTTSSDSINITVSEMWHPANIFKHEIKGIKKLDNKIFVNVRYERYTDIKQYFEGEICIEQDDRGWINFLYDIKPHNVKGVFLEAGLSLCLSDKLSEFRFIGNGPYPSYPGKSMHVESGIYHINSEDLNYAGTYPHVNVALFTDKKGKGFVLFPNNIGISIEKNKDKIILSHVPYISGTYAKKSLPDYKIKSSEVKRIKGSFTIIPINDNWNQYIRNLFGNPNDKVIPFDPFYHYYDR